MPGFLRSPQISQRQHCGISCPAQQLEGDHCVGGEHQQRGIGGGWRHGGQRRGYRRLDATSRLQAREKGRQTRPRRFHRTWE